ncbi:hypothetical protein ACWEN3_33280 [Streptomyces sp. NPDC004561]
MKTGSVCYSGTTAADLHGPHRSGPQPYWNAGPAYALWAGGYFGGAGGVVGAVLAGTLLGSLLSAPSAFADGGDGFLGTGDLPEGGEFSGADFNASDFRGSFGGLRLRRRERLRRWRLAT